MGYVIDSAAVGRVRKRWVTDGAAEGMYRKWVIWLMVWLTGWGSKDMGD